MFSPFEITLFTSSPNPYSASRYAALHRSVDLGIALVSWTIITGISTAFLVEDVVAISGGVEATETDVASLWLEIVIGLPT